MIAAGNELTGKEKARGVRECPRDYGVGMLVESFAEGWRK